MQNPKPKLIGTVSLYEIINISTSSPWEVVTTNNIPTSALGTPNGFLFTHGSACSSLPTTSLEGYTYVADFYLFRIDRNGVDTDRYIESVTPTNTLAILKVPNEQNNFHHLKPTSSIIENLPIENQEQVQNILNSK